MNGAEALPYTTTRIPYDDRKGKALWPDGARMAVLVYTCPEQWDWSHNEPMPPVGALVLPNEPRPSLSTRTAVGYGFEIGLRRIRDVVLEHEVPLTLGTTGNAAQRYPDLLAELAGHGFEVAAHGFSEGIPPVFLSRDEQSTDIDRTVEAIEKAVGVTPRGWWSPGAACTTDTVELLAEKGFRYHGDLQDDELPYLIESHSRTLVEIPYNMVTNINDYFLFTSQRRSADEHLGYLTSTFDAYYAQAASTPLHLILGTHPFVTGKPDAAAVLARFLEYMQSHDDVWFATYSEVADWWWGQHVQDGS